MREISQTVNGKQILILKKKKILIKSLDKPNAYIYSFAHF